MGDPVIRAARPDDFQPTLDLYNHYVRETAFTFDIEPLTEEQRRPWFEKFGATGPYRLFVAEEGGAVIGYAGSSELRPKRAYETSVETTIYLAQGATGRGLGRRLYQALFDALAGEDVHRAFAGITLPNPASIALHESLGFSPAGVWSEAGRKFDRYHNVAWYEKAL
jgi:phosphinothricin acetyltransferase